MRSERKNPKTVEIEQESVGLSAAMVPSALPVLALLLLLLPSAQTRCYFQAKALCRYSGKSFKLGESWLGPDCQLCTCLHPVGVGCCEM
ncbi:prostate-associated microseminoprotein [Bufo gargarizans]|uniref:prostate-associated microseminoprotein n=1 Tax=Bufo gargarizans TaxID=30331 RepID=UPI001CF0FCEF|nr:prostate-associated microseminoprotein [Bufo gargarizans]